MRKTENSFEYFVYFIFPIVIFVLGLIGNIVGLFLAKTKKLSQIGPVNTYRYLLLNDCIHLTIVSLNYYFVNGFSFGFSLLSDLTCKFYKYTAHVTGSNAKLFLIYILIERYLAVKFPVESNQFRSKKYQLVYLISVTVINSIYYIPSWFSFSIEHHILGENSTTVICGLIQDKRLTIQFLVFSAEIVIPSIVILIYSAVLIFTIRKSNSRMSTFYTPKEIEIFRKDVNLSLMAIVMNLLGLIANLSFIIIFYLFQNFSFHIKILGFNFYLLISTFRLYFFLAFSLNLFREAFISTFRTNRNTTQAKDNEEIEMF